MLRNYYILKFKILICEQLYKAALANCFEEEEWGPIEWLTMAKHFERQMKPPYAYHAVSNITFGYCADNHKHIFDQLFVLFHFNPPSLFL